MAFETEVTDAFPEVNEIRDEDLREKVVDAWVTTLVASDFESLYDVPWFPQSADVIGEQSQVEHIRDVITASIAVTDLLIERRGMDIDRDVVVAAAITHDIDKLLEMSEESFGDLGDWMPHPHMAAYVLEDHAIPYHVQHIALSHSPFSGVDPRTFEAKLIQLIDLLVAHGVFWNEDGKLLGE